MASEGDDVAEGGGGAADEGVGDGLADDGAAHGNVAAGDALGDGHEVGGDVPVLAGEHLAGASEAGDDFVGDEEAAVAVTDFPKHGPVVVGGDDGAVGAGDGLGDDGGDGLGALELDDILDGLDAELGAFLGGLAAVLTAVGVGLGAVEASGEEGFVVGLGKGGGASQGQGAEGCAVVGTLAADELGAQGFAYALEVGAGDFHGGLDGLGAAAGEEGAGEVAGGYLGDLLGEADGGLGGAAEGHVGELEHLLVGGVGDLGAAVANVFEPETGHGVDVGVARGVGDAAALAFDEDLGFAFFRHFAGFAKVDPEVFEGGAAEFFDLVGGVGDHNGSLRMKGMRCPGGGFRQESSGR